MIYDAIQITLEAHKHQLRKIDKGYYAAHPLEVAIILAQNGADEDVITAGILHDTVEDTTLTLAQISQKFGEKIAYIVNGCTEPAKEVPWQVRKKWAIDHLKQQATRDIKMVICADKLSNIRSIHRNMDKQEDVWSHFHAPCERQKWYYESMFEGLSELADTAMYQELKTLVNLVFGENAC